MHKYMFFVIILFTNKIGPRLYLHVIGQQRKIENENDVDGVFSGRASKCSRTAPENSEAPRADKQGVRCANAAEKTLQTQNYQK